MATIMNPNFLPSLKAGADLTAGKNIAVKMDASGDVVAAGAGEKAIGFLQNAPASGKSADVATIGGGAFAIAGGNIDEGAELKVDSSGHLVAATADGDFVVARALTSAVDNDVFSVLVVQYPLFVSA